MKYEKVVVGGTFDFLHDGHKAILSKAFEIGDRVLIGLVSDKMELWKDAAGVPPMDKRKKGLEDFLGEKGWLDRAEFEFISDPIGPAGDDEEIEAIVVSDETASRAEKINEIRSDKGLEELDIVEIPLVLADDGEPISSIRVRYKEIDVHGNVKKTEERISDSG